jgi:predicted transcriptional regulator
MLSKLFGSICRVKILKIFLLNPDNKYYIRQLARDLNLQVNAVRRELNNLTNIGLIQAEKETIKGKRYYFCNQNSILFLEMKALFSKAQLLSCQDFIDKLQKLYTPKFLMLSGFFVGNSGSLTDLFLVGNFNKQKIINLISELEKDLGLEINYTIMNQAEFIYRRQIVDRFLSDLLKQKNLIVLGHEMLDDERLAEANSKIPVK